MESMITYLWKASALLIIFYLCYLFLLRKETTFELNRKFLLGGLISSMVLPMIYFTKIVYVKASSIPFNLQPLSEDFQQIPVEENINWWQIIGVVYLLITGFFMLRLILQLISVIKIIANTPKQKQSGFSFLKTSEEQSPFSFFRYIVYNPESHSEKDLDLILEHEKTHAKQMHSADILLANLISCILWFNPISWLYKKSVEQNLEYIADRETVTDKIHLKDYQQALVKVSIADLKPALTNHFYQSFIKKRILMLNKENSSNNPTWKLSLVMPLILAFMLLFNVKTEAQVVSPKNKEKVETAAAQKIPATTENEAEEFQLEVEEIEAPETPGTPEIVTVNVDEITYTESPKKIWTAKNKVPGRHNFNALGKNPLFIINGKEYKASRLKNKYIAVGQELEVFIGSNATSRYGKSAKDGVVVIPHGKVTKDFDEDMEEINENSSFRKSYLFVGDNGKPAFVTLSRGAHSAPQHRVFVSETSNFPKPKARAFKVRTAGKPGKFVIHEIPSNKNDINAFQYHVNDNVSEKVHVKFTSTDEDNGSGEVRMISQENKPLYIVDGVVKEDFDASSLDENEIATINIFKDSYAIEKYGEKAKHGVVKIVTKSAASLKGNIYKIHANQTDAELDVLKKKVKEEIGYTLELKNIKRNSDGEINNIDIKFYKDGHSASSTYSSGSNSIPEIHFGVNPNGGVMISSRN